MPDAPKPKIYYGRRFLANTLQSIATTAQKEGNLRLALEACRLLLVVQSFVTGKQTRQVSKNLDALLAGLPAYEKPKTKTGGE